MDKKLGAKATADIHKSGTHVPDKDFGTKKKESKAAGTGKPEKGSLASAAAGTDATEKKSWGGSPEDWVSDYRESKRKGISSDQWEDSASDRLSDNAGERKMKAESEKSEAPEYKSGGGAFTNKPKTSHGFGHTAVNHDGHHRMSGHSGAHRIGKKR